MNITLRPKYKATEDMAVLAPVAEMVRTMYKEKHDLAEIEKAVPNNSEYWVTFWIGITGNEENASLHCSILNRDDEVAFFTV